MLLISLFIVFCGETVLRQDIFAVFKWIGHYPIVFGLNSIMIFALLMVFTCTFNHIGIGCLITSILYMTACIISFYKFRISGEYLIPEDIFLLGEATTISKNMNMKLENNVVFNVLGILGLIGIAFKLKTFSVAKYYRILNVVSFMGIFVVAAKLGASVYQEPTNNTNTIPAIMINEEYNEKGFLIGFGEEVAELVIERPVGYSKDKINKLSKAYETKNLGSNFKKPNIIMIMSEGFFDIDRLPNVSFSKDPLEHFKSYQEQFTKGNIITAIYGGRTCQTEYEVLTGHSVDFTGPENIAYMTLVKENTPSIAKLLKAEGYTTVGIHAYEKTFFSRDKAYPNLGIDTFIASEDFKDPKLVRGYISDKEVANKIIETYEQKGEAPLFIHTVSMQNHMPYEDTYRANQIDIKTDKLKSKENNILTTYANGIADSDAALKQLVDYFSQQEEPTIIVMYGDHLPALGEQYKVYKDLDYISEAFNQRDCFNLYQTPFVIWNNYNLPKADLGYIDASYLGAEVLSYTGYTKDPYINFLARAKKTLRAYNKAFILEANGKLNKANDLSQKENKLLEEMWMLQYDRLFE